MQLSPHTTAWATAFANRWCKLADDGIIYVPDLLQFDAANAVLLAVHALRLKALGGKSVVLHIDCKGGDDTCEQIARVLLGWGHPTTAYCGPYCYSAGLYLAIACDLRYATPDCEFLFHGSPYKNGARIDAADADYFASRTHMPAEFWAEKAASGEHWKFCAEEALELGVIHEIREGGYA